MNKPFKHQFADLEWEYNMDHFDQWRAGRTGFPIGQSRPLDMPLLFCHPLLTRLVRA